MSKVLKTAAVVVGAVALVASGIGAAAGVGIGLGLSASTLATIATVATVASVAAGALTIAANLTAGKPTANATGSQEQFSADPDAGIPLALGRTGTAGNIGFRRGWDTRDAGDNDRQAFVAILSLGPIAAIEGMTVDKVPTFFGGTGAAIGAFAGFMWSMTQLGAMPEPALGFGAGAGTPPGWSAQCGLSGKAAASWTLRFDTKAKVYQSGVPAPMWTVKGALAYDPTKDSTYPGGNGPHRMADPADTAAYDAAVATWEWTENPYLLGLRWAHGFWQRDPRVPGSTYQRVMGMGAPWAGIDVPAFVEGRNIAQANGWTCGGIIFSGDEKWASMKKILQAGMGEPLALGAKISCLVNAPKVSLATITIDDVIGEASVSATQPRRNRFNTVTPRYRLEANNWQLLPGAPISVAEHVAEDRGKRSKVLDYPFIQNTPQIGTAVRYDIENAREFGPIVLPLKLVWMGYKPGDCVTANLPEVGLNNQPILLLNRDLDPSAGVTTMTARSETAGKHAFALGQAATPPPTPGVTGPMLIPTPGAAAWTISGTSIVSAGSVAPALIVTGAVDAGSAEAIVLEYRPFVDGQAAGAGWAGAGVFEPSLIRQEIVSVQGASAYEVAVSYRRQGFTGDRRVIGPVVTGGTKLDFSGVTGPTRPADHATNSADPNSPFGDSTVKEAVAKLERIVPIEERFDPIETDVSALKEARVDADAALTALTGRVDDSAGDISALKDADAKTAEALADLGGAVADQGAAQRQVGQAVGRIEEGLLRTLLESARTRDVLRDAGIVVDPATGQVRIYAVDQLKDRTASAEVAIDGVKGLVATKASVNFVQEQIALAVLDPGQVAELEPIIARLAQAESAIDGLNAAVTLKASVAELTALAARTRTAEIDIDAMKGAIALKANADVVDQIGLRTSEIEQTLTALPDTAGLVVSVRQARGAADGSADAMLRSLLSGETAAKYQVSQLAQARQELSTRMDDGFSAAAIARTALSAKVDAASALVLTEAEASITRDAALTRQLTAQGLVLDGQTAAIGRLDEARIDAAGGIAGAQMTIRQMRGAAGESDEALLRALAAGETSAQTRAAQLVQIQTDFTTTLIADKAASAIAQQAILARMGAAEAAIFTTSKVLADTTGAYGSRINALELAYADPVSGQAATQVRINAVERGSAEADAALGQRIEAVDAIVNDALTGLRATRAQLTAGLKAAADQQSALVERFDEMQAELDDPNTGLVAAIGMIVTNRKAQVDGDAALTEQVEAQGAALGEQAAAIGRLDRTAIDNTGGIAGTQMTIRQVTAAADTDAEALLRSMAAGEIAGQTRAAQLVQIQAEFTTSLVAGQLSEATARQALLTRMGLAEAAIVSTSKAVADAQKAFTSRQDALEAAFNDAATGLAATRARIVALAELTADQNKATTERLDLIDAQLLDPTTGKPISGATIAADRKAAADANTARVSDISQLRGDVFDGPSGLPAVSGRIDHERELSLERDNALGIDIDRLAVEIHDPDDGLAAAHASIAAERQASVTRDNANAQAVQQVTARLDGIGGVGVEQSIETVVNRLGVIEGRYTVTIDGNGNLTGFQLIGSDAGPGTLNLINTDLRMGTGRIVLNTGSFMQVQGLGFGKDSDLIEWFGPTMAISQCSRANGVTYKTLTGIAYFGGGLAAGVIKNAVQTTDTAYNAVLDSGVFGSNGRSRRVVVSYNWSRVAEIPRAQAAGNGAISAQLLIYRGSTQIGELNVAGKWTATAYGGSSNPARSEEDMGGAVPVNDNFGGTSVVYRVVLATRTLGPGPTSAPSFDSQAQVISLIQTEE